MHRREQLSIAGDHERTQFKDRRYPSKVLCELMNSDDEDYLE
jgi:hypothetical protein